MAHSRKRSSQRRGRSLRMESLERRNLLAGDVFHNYLTPGDVNNDNQVSTLDALTVINQLNRSGASGQGEQVESSAFADVNDDGHTSAIDALMVINQLNQDAGSRVASGQELQARLSGPSGERAKVEIDDEHGILKLEVKIQNALPGESYEVAIAGSVVATLVTNARGRASLETSGLSTAVAAAGDTVNINGIGTAMFVGKGSGNDDHDGDQSDNRDDISQSENDHGVVDWDSDGSSNDGDDLPGDHDDDVSIDDRSDSDGTESSHSDGNVPDDSNNRSPVTPVVSGSQDGQWQAHLTGNGSAEIEFENNRGESEFNVDIRGFTPNGSFPVTIDGVVVGQVRSDSRGRGKLEYEIGDHDDRPFPADFPVIASGVTIQIGSQLSGVFESHRSQHGEGNDHDSDNHDD